MANDNPVQSVHCLSDEDIACWQIGMMAPGQISRIGGHLKDCAHCRGLVAAVKEVVRQQEREGIQPAPAQLAARARELLPTGAVDRIIDAVVTIADGIYQAVETSGQVIFAPWLPAATALRDPGTPGSRAILLEATRQSTRCRLEFSRQDGGRHTVSAVFRDAAADQPLAGLQCVLYRDGCEVEAQAARTGRAVFEDLLPGDYRMEISFPGVVPRSRFLTFSLVPA